MRTIKLYLQAIASLIGASKLVATLLVIAYIGISTTSFALMATMFAIAIILVTLLISNIQES